MNIAACVILYNPIASEIISNINTYLPFVKKIYIFDNSLNEADQLVFKNLKKTEYYWDGENKGISIRLNDACDKAIKENFDYLLTMDQDSYFDTIAIKQYFESIVHFADHNKVAVYGLEYNRKDINSKTAITTEVDHIITSASVLNLKLFSVIGGFDNNLFIDGVDIDFCFSAICKGYKNIKFCNISFSHSLGTRTKRGSIFTLYLFKKYVSVHSSLRIYYMFRNMLYIKNKYEKILPEIIRKFEKNQRYHISKNIRYSDEYIKVLKYKHKACQDFRQNKMGKIDPSFIF